jgi:hypothetical protein
MLRHKSSANLYAFAKFRMMTDLSPCLLALTGYAEVAPQHRNQPSTLTQDRAKNLLIE